MEVQLWEIHKLSRPCKGFFVSRYSIRTQRVHLHKGLVRAGYDDSICVRVRAKGLCVLVMTTAYVCVCVCACVQKACACWL